MGRNSKSRRDAKKKKEQKNRNRQNSSNQKAKIRSTTGPVMTMMDNPLSGLTDEQRKDLIAELGKKSKEKVIELLDSVDSILRKYDPITLMSIISGYGLTIGAGDNGVQSKESSGGVSQSHVELLQALALQIPENELGQDPVTPDAVQKAWEQLIELSQAFTFSRMSPEILESNDNEKAIHQVQELIRSHTQSVRNWGFHSQSVGISKEIYSHFDKSLHSNFGFSASDVINLFKELTDVVEEKLSERLKILSGLKSIKKPYDMLLSYLEVIGQGKEAADKFTENFDIAKISHQNLFLMLLSHFDLRMSDYYLIDSEYLSKKIGLDKDTIENILYYFSYEYGDLASEKKEFFFLENPIWKKPIVKSDDGYYCVLPQLFFSFVLYTLDELVESIDKEGLHNRRAAYLESKIEEIVKTRFPESHIVSGLEWSLGEDKYETDLILFIDSHAIIVEAKSQKISRPALRGAPARIKRHLEEIIIEPGIQSYRLEQRLNELRSQDEPSDALLSNIPVDIHSINKVLRVSVSLEDFATLQTNLRLFNDTGWIPDDYSSCPTMNLADFETLFDFLEHPVQIIHYLQRRTELEGKYKFIGDELDFMGLYITTLLNVGNMVNDDETEVAISGMSEPLDKYYISRDQGISIDKPQPKTSSLFRKVFNKLEERSTPRWTEIGSILSRFPPADQKKLAGYVSDLTKIVNKTWQTEGHKNTAVYQPVESSEYALAIVLFKEENKDRRYEFIENAYQLGLEPEHVKYCLVIAINIDDDNLPYHYIALTEDKENTLHNETDAVASN